MTGFRNNYISAARSGGSGYILLCAIIAAIQDPGSSNMRFSVSTYMIIFGALLTLPLFAYKYIVDLKIGLRGSSLADPHIERIGSSKNQLEMSAKNALLSSPHFHEDVESAPSNKSERPSRFEVANPLQLADETVHGSSSSSPSSSSSAAMDFRAGTESQKTTDSTRDTYPPDYGQDIIRDALNDMMATLASFLVSDKRHEDLPWLRRTVPYMMTVGWVNFNTWGMVVALMPFAMSNVSAGAGNANLAIAYEAAAVLLVLGAVISIHAMLCITDRWNYCVRRRPIHHALSHADLHRHHHLHLLLSHHLLGLCELAGLPHGGGADHLDHHLLCGALHRSSPRHRDVPSHRHRLPHRT